MTVYNTYVFLLHVTNGSAGLSKVWARGKLNLWAP